MALCSLAFTPSTKRSCDFSTLQLLHGSATKRVCLSKIDLNSSAKRFSLVCFDKLPANACFSSSESDNDSDDQQSCYVADQIRAKRRASSRVSFSLDNKLSKAVSQYSDDDEEDYEQIKRASTRKTDDDDNLDCKLLSSPCTSSVYINSHNGNIQMSHHRNSSTAGFFQISDSSSSTSSTKKSMPESDKNSRAKCLDYLVGAIDEAWARYCDAASYVEEETYGYNTPCSVATDDEDEFGNTTDLTDYDSDFERHHITKPLTKKPSIMGSTMARASDETSWSSTAKDPSSCQLQALKDRLTKAKYFLQDLVDSDDYNDAFAFWKRWDMIKYATIELVEDDDDDDVMESTIDELEEGRLFTN